MIRKIVEIDEEKCDGCGLCIPDCPEGALQMIDGKARVISDIYCDGLGACIGACPQDAIKVVEREAEAYDEKKVMERIVKQGKEVIKAHLEHLKEHNEEKYLKEAEEYLEENGIENPIGKIEEKEFQGCPGTAVQDFRDKESSEIKKQESELKQWPVQLHLVGPAPYFEDSDLLIAADCVPFAYGNFHSDFLKGKSLVIACPKLDEVSDYSDRLGSIIKECNVKSVTVVTMEVPCCFGLQSIAEEAVKKSGKDIEVKTEIVTVQGNKQ
ncbi:4Fe-4S ferredoxin [archaeon]|nr:4Fe-4S ferredoxin [archaeon]